MHLALKLVMSNVWSRVSDRVCESECSRQG